jgi:hypothetical protein
LDALVSYSWQSYISDDGVTYAVKVRLEYVVMAERGWFANAVPGDLQYPRGWRLRRVVGLTVDGRTVFADCAHIDSDLWSGATSVFTYIDSSGAHALANSIGTQRERRLLIPDQP